MRYVSQAEYDAQQKRIDELKQQLEQAISNAEDAKQFGDLSENAEYEEAMKAQDLLHNQLEKEITILKDMAVGDSTTGSAEAAVEGCIVTLMSDSGQPLAVKLGNSTNVCPPCDNTIGVASINSNFGRAIMNKRTGDTVSYIDNAFRTHAYTIKSIVHDTVTC